MSKERVIKYVRHPSFSAAQLTARNPYIEIGEVVFELNGSNLSKKFKVGPGYWNDLSYFEDDIYLLTTTAAPIGDASGNLSGLTSRQIIEKMLNPYQIPAFTSVVNNAGVGFASIKTLDIGQTLSGSVTINYAISNTGNLVGLTPINVSAGNIFSNEGAKAHSGSFVMSLVSSLSPSTIATYNINLTATHARGVTSPVVTTIRWFPKLIWGTTAVVNPNANDINNLTQKQTLTSNIFKRDYVFNSSGYCTVAIPAMLNPTTMTFTDVTDPNAPAGFSMENLGNISINNGVGTYLYTILRSSFYITASTSILRIS